ncbi:MAG TPA: hypothetical protein VFZ26_04775, partial [Gemmatimonadales bacterium]
ARARAPTIKDVPADDPGPPWYTPVFGGGPVLPGAYIPSDGTWAAVVFWREPACIPATFDLLRLMDIPAAFACPLTVAGRAWFSPGSPIPTQERYDGLGAVPVAFVLLSELQAAMGDSPTDLGAEPDLYLAELTALPSFNLGAADVFRTVIHNSTQAANPGHEVVDARGSIQSGPFAGRRFRYHHNERFDPESGIHSFQSVVIAFD